jgi:hypothetical protein
MANIQDTIAQAQAAAGDIFEAVVVQDLPTYPQAPPQSYKRPSMDTLGTSIGIAKLVKNWLKVNQFGMTLNKDRKILDEVKVTLDMTQDVGFFLKESLKWGNPTKYASTYDGGATADKGGSFADQLQKARYETGEEIEPFPSADVVLHLVKPLKVGENTLEAGTAIGHSFAKTNWDEWVEFFRDVNTAGLIGTTVGITITSEEVNHNNYNWGILKLKLT